MEDVKDKINGIRQIFGKIKDEMYAIQNPVTASLDEYIKSLYIRMLCTIVQYNNDPSDMQILYINRLRSGMGVDDETTDFMRKALDIKADEIKEFVEYMKKSTVRYYFGLEAIILAVISDSNDNNFEYLGELLEVISITKKELQYLCLVAKSVILQDSATYDEAKKYAEGTIRQVDFTTYIQNYYAGAIVDSKELLVYSAPDINCEQNVQYPNVFRNKTIKFENLVISLSSDWIFNGCNSISFENCKFVNPGNNKLQFDSIENLSFSKCEFSQFKNSVMNIRGVKKIDISFCTFLNCSSTCHKEDGGLINFKEKPYIIQINFLNNRMQNCNLITHTYSCCGVLLNFNENYYHPTNIQLSVNNNEFMACSVKNKDNTERSEYIIAGIKSEHFKVIGKNNKCIGQVDRIFDNDYVVNR